MDPVVWTDYFDSPWGSSLGRYLKDIRAGANVPGMFLGHLLDGFRIGRPSQIEPFPREFDMVRDYVRIQRGL
jgi:hypothetical protein